MNDLKEKYGHTHYYFSTKDEKLQYGDGRPIVVGETHEVEVTPRCCRQGLHASLDILDALEYAPGPILFGVTLSGVIDRHDDKEAATKRSYKWRLDLDDILKEFARKYALAVVHLWDAPDVVIEYLETGDESLRAAARGAAWANAWDNAWDNARDAARDAARANGWDNARAKQREVLETLIKTQLDKEINDD